MTTEEALAREAVRYVISGEELRHIPTGKIVKVVLRTYTYIEVEFPRGWRGAISLGKLEAI